MSKNASISDCPLDCPLGCPLACDRATAPLWRFALLWACCWASLPPAQAQGVATAAEAPLNVPAAALREGAILLQQAAQLMAPAGAKLRVQLGGIDKRLQLAPCQAATAYLSTGVQPWGNSRFGVRCTQGANWNVQVQAKVEVWAEAMVASVPLAAGTTLTADHLRRRELDWGLHPVATASAAGLKASGSLHEKAQDLLGRVLARPLAPGAAVHVADLQMRQWFAAGATVTVNAVGDGFSVSSEGQALSAGLEGQWVRVRTESGKVISGKAVAERRVEIKL